MSRKMKFWDKKPHIYIWQIGDKIRWVDVASVMKFDRPLASNVIRDHYRWRQIALQTRDKDVINIDVSIIHASVYRMKNAPKRQTYLSPFWRSPMAVGRFMSCLLHSTVAIPVASVPFPPHMLANLIASWLLHVLLS